MNPLLALAIVVLLPASATAADIYKCPTAAGKIEYRDRPCDGAAGQKVKAKDNSAGTGDDLASIRARDAEFAARQMARRDAADKVEADNRTAQERAYREERAHQGNLAIANAIREGNAQRAADEYNSYLVRQPTPKVQVEIVNRPSKPAARTVTVK